MSNSWGVQYLSQRETLDPTPTVGGSKSCHNTKLKPQRQKSGVRNLSQHETYNTTSTVGGSKSVTKQNLRPNVNSRRFKICHKTKLKTQRQQSEVRNLSQHETYNTTSTVGGSKSVTTQNLNPSVNSRRFKICHNTKLKTQCQTVGGFNICHNVKL